MTVAWLGRRGLLAALAALCLAVPLRAEGDTLHSAIKPVPRSGAWQDRHKSFLARAAKGDVEVLFLGDSITQGWEGHGRAVWAKRIAPLKAANFGIGGDRTQHVLWRITEGGELGGIKPEMIVVMIGTNNMGSNTEAQIAEGVAKIVGALRERAPQAHILVHGIFPRAASTDAPVRDKVARTNGRIAKLADGKKIHYLDIGDKFLGKDGTLSREIMPDLLHLSERGYQIWADAVVFEIKKLLKK